MSRAGPAGTTPWQFKGHDDRVACLAYQHAGPLLASAAADVVLFWQPARRAKVVDRVDFAAALTCVAWSPDDKMLAVATERGGVAALVQA